MCMFSVVVLTANFLSETGRDVIAVPDREVWRLVRNKVFTRRHEEYENC